MSVRLGADQDRHQLLQTLPYEESIHLCLLSDDPADEVIEFCRLLSGPPIHRRHLSIIAGGWPEVARLAEGMGFIVRRSFGALSGEQICKTLSAHSATLLTVLVQKLKKSINQFFKFKWIETWQKKSNRD